MIDHNNNNKNIIIYVLRPLYLYYQTNRFSDDITMLFSTEVAFNDFCVSIEIGTYRIVYESYFICIIIRLSYNIRHESQSIIVMTPFSNKTLNRIRLLFNIHLKNDMK